MRLNLLKSVSKICNSSGIFEEAFVGITGDNSVSLERYIVLLVEIIAPNVSLFAKSLDNMTE